MKRTKLFTKFAVVSLVLFAAASLPAQAPKQEQLLNGLKVMMWPDKSAGDVKVRIRVHAGSAFDPQGKEGVMQLLADNLFPNEASREFFAEDLGGDLNVVTTHDYIQITASSKPDQYLTMLETLASAISNPAIDKETTTKLRAALTERLKLRENDATYVADRAAASRLLGTFPYGRPQMGSVESVSRIGFADLIDARQRFLTADNASITISGNFDRGLGYRAVRRYFGSWLRSDKRVPSTFRQPDEVPSGVLTIGSPQPDAAVVRAAIRGTARNSKDRAVCEIFAKVLESRLKARISAEISRDVTVRSESHVQPGLIVLGFTTGRNDIGNTNGKINVTELISKALSDAVSDAEFDAARSAVRLEWQKKAVEDLWLDADTYRLTSVDADRTAIEKATAAETRAFADRLRVQPIAFVVVGGSK